MLKRNKVYFVCMFLILCAMISGMFSALFGIQEEPFDNVYINFVIEKLNNNEKVENTVYDYTVFSFDGSVIFSSVETKEMTYFERLNEAARKGDFVADCRNGKVVFYTSPHRRALLTHARSVSAAILAAGSLLLLLLTLAHTVWLHYRVIKPFDALHAFAENISKGEFDTPLLMDKGNHFGAFSEAFDIMRDNLNAARESEAKAVMEKRELIAQINHDFKTPLSSIRAIAELKNAKKADADLLMIIQKINQIDNIWNDLYRAASEESKQSLVKSSLHEIREIIGLIRIADYRKAVILDVGDLSGKVKYDSLRLGEVFDNVLTNSYKYADTLIHGSITKENNFLKIELKDEGKGVDEDEIPKLTEKFYRGKNADFISGAGLGLYISAELMRKMGGRIDFFNERGFGVQLFLPLS